MCSSVFRIGDKVRTLVINGRLETVAFPEFSPLFLQSLLGLGLGLGLGLEDCCFWSLSLVAMRLAASLD